MRWGHLGWAKGRSKADHKENILRRGVFSADSLRQEELGCVSINREGWQAGAERVKVESGVYVKMGRLQEPGKGFGFYSKVQ